MFYNAQCQDMRSNKYAAAITEIDSCKGSELESFITQEINNLVSWLLLAPISRLLI